MSKDKYDVSLFMFTKEGYLLNHEYSKRIFDGEDEDAVVDEYMKTIDVSDPLSNIKALSSVKNIDLFYPVIHGNLGEDGTIQGLFKLLNKPYVGSNVLSSAMAFDKDITKRILNEAGIRNTKYILVTDDTVDSISYTEAAHHGWT